LIVRDSKILVLRTNLEELKGDKTVHWDLPGGMVKRSDDIETTLRK
jgi:hypothetical protein